MPLWDDLNEGSVEIDFDPKPKTRCKRCDKPISHGNFGDGTHWIDSGGQACCLMPHVPADPDKVFIEVSREDRDMIARTPKDCARVGAHVLRRIHAACRASLEGEG